MPGRNQTFFLAIILAIAFSFFKGAFDSQPITSQQDQKEYRYLELDNELRVLLISDESADQAGASLDVHAGSLQDPKHRPGLAHFLEHMLFLGTETYPTAGDYQAFISQHGGHHNAFTSAEHTNYFFQIEGSQLKGALDRFSKFFHEPLFTEEYVQREKDAVNSEYKSKYKDDYRRIQYVLKTAVNKSHPASHFATGNLETLSDNEDSKVRDDLLKFYQRYYSSNLMTLTIYGPQDLDTLYKWANTLFSPIKNKDSVVDAYPEHLYDNTPLDIQIKPVKDLYRLGFTFELDTALDNFKQKPASYIGHLLGHEGEGSLLAWLKTKGWAEGLSAGTYHQLRNDSAFQVNISLTQQGLDHTDEITEQLFAYINLIKEHGIESWIFDEINKLSRMHFEFQPGQQPANLVQGLSMAMHEYPAKHILNGPYLWEDFDPDSIESVLARMIPENTIRTLVAPNVKTDTNETWFNAPFKKQTTEDRLIQQWKNAKLAQGLFIPKANPFVPENVTVLENSESTQPELIEQQAGLEVWHFLDTHFKGPQSSLYINLQSPLSQKSAHNQVIIDAWVQLLNDHLNSFSYPALLAGQEYSLYHHMRGLGIRLHGYRDKQDVLLKEILTAINNFEPSEDKWETVQQELTRAYQNALKQKPYERTMAELGQYLLKPSFDENTLLAAIEKATLKDLLDIKQKYFDALHVVVMGHGNITKQQLNTASNVVKTSLLENTQAIDVKRKQLDQLPNGLSKKQVTAQHQDHAMTLYFQAQTDSQKERATLGLIGQIIKAPYYTLMRTQRKHGYIVFATPYPILKQGGLAFIVQSPTTTSQQLLNESQTFLKDFVGELKDMNAKDFTAHQQGLVNNLLKKPLSLKEKSNVFWREIDENNTEFNSKKILADHVSELDKTTLIDYIEQYLLSEKAKSLVLYHDDKQEH